MADFQSHTIDSTPRGFGIYADFVDNYKQRVRVQQSSAASGDFCWVFLGPDAEGAHLTVDQARTVADALLGWIADVAQDKDAGVTL